ARAELARKVARMWEEQLADSREAADAWRRVLRMKSGDAEATAGLERAKQNMLKKPDPDASDAYAPPKLAASSSSVPIAPKVNVHTAETLDAPPESKPSTTLETASPSGEVPEARPAESAPTTDEPPPNTETEEADVFTGALPGGKAQAAPPPSSAKNASSPARAERPRDVWFRSSQDEVTMSALSGSAPGSGSGDQDTTDQGAKPYSASGSPALSPSDGVFTSAPRTEPASKGSAGSTARELAEADSMTDSGADDDFGSTNEVAAFDDSLLESTAARPQRASEVSTAAGLDVTGLNPPGAVPEEDDDVVVADDLADLIEVEDEEEHPAASAEDTTDQEKPKRKTSSLPPPLPRS
ncbi:MAG: hypothetical protein ACLQVI_03450, partial [Polyangiaceae bacterium]